MSAEDEPSTAPSLTPSQSASAPDKPVPATCRDGGPIGVGRGVVEAATGHRYLQIVVRNCSDEPVQLRRPELASGDTGKPLNLTTNPLALEPDSRVRLAPGKELSFGIEWLAAPRGQWIGSMLVDVADGVRPSRLALPSADIRQDTKLTYHPWSEQPFAQ